MADKISKKHRSWNMSRIKSKNTAPEIRFRSLLHAAGFRYRLNVSNLPGKPDLVLKKYNSVIFVHGCFWHRHKNCKFATTPKSRTEFWNKKFQDNVSRDLRNQRELRLTGWQVLIVWECEIRQFPDRVLDRVRKQLIAQNH
ncbi:very short patch repair endonuclease [Roseibium sp.]|uniref:very short patch repair endonuclease n=1 Tax=Roseibium sp. TaxID=1936156 RepID=UPI003A97451B